MAGGPQGTYVVPPGIHKIRHVIIIMQENRSFDSYVGTLPGADGISMKDGKPTACVPNPATAGCDRPFHDVQDANGGGPHGAYLRSARRGSLPAVSWITPSEADSEHPPASVHQGQPYVTAVVNAAMESPEWDSTAIFLGWDDWGGFYTHTWCPRRSTPTATGLQCRAS